jgi:hypothetical protein
LSSVRAWLPTRLRRALIASGGLGMVRPEIAGVTGIRKWH